MVSTHEAIEPLAEVGADSLITALPKAEIHVHQEWSPRLDRVLARRQGRQSYNWRRWAQQLMAETPPGMPRLQQLATLFPADKEADAAPENFIARLEDLLEEAVADGAVLVEVRLGGETVLRPGVMELFHEAERRARARHPRLRAEAIATVLLWYEPERLAHVVQTCERLVTQGLRGIDFLYEPYDTETDWKTAYRTAERAAAAGLGITAHAGEFSPANVASALRVPGLTRLGHATYAASDPPLLDLLAESGVTVECSLTSNVVLGAAPSYADHPLRQFVAQGIPVALCTDDPVQFCTTIGREYAVAHALGFSPSQLLAFTRNAVRAAFTTSSRRRQLMVELDTWEAEHLSQGTASRREGAA